MQFTLIIMLLALGATAEVSGSGGKFAAEKGARGKKHINSQSAGEGDKRIEKVEFFQRNKKTNGGDKH